MITKFVKIFVVVCLALPPLSFPQSKTGTTIGQFLKIEPSARFASMGNAAASLSGEAAAAFYNPASLGRLMHSDVQFTHSQWFADIAYNYAAVAIQISGLGNLMLQLISLDSGEIDVRTVEQPLGTGERYSATSLALGAGYGLLLTDRVSVGVHINYIRESIWHSHASDFGLNFGVQYQVAPGGLTLGASVSNFGPRTSYDGRDLFVDFDFEKDKFGDNDQLPAELRTEDYPLPTLFRVGVSYPLHLNEMNVFTLAIDATHPNDNNESVNIGAEWKTFGILMLRGGYRELFLTDAEGGLVLGAGLRLDVTGYNLRFDYAWADYGRLDQTHRFAIGMGF